MPVKRRMQSGIRRRLDDLGRIVLPKEIRHSLGWKENDFIDIVADTVSRTVTLSAVEVTPEEYAIRSLQEAFDATISSGEKRQKLIADAEHIINRYKK